MAVYMTFSNKFISANNQDEPDVLRVFDSDGELIDYITPSFCFEYNDFETVYKLMCLFMDDDKTDRDIADFLAEIFEDVKEVVYDPDLEKLYEIHGHEFINRVGTCALIMKE